MKKREIAQWRGKNLKELQALLEETQRQLVKLQMETKTGKNKNRRQIARTRDDLARVLTVIREKKDSGTT